MRSSIDDAIFEMVQLPKGSQRRAELEWELILAGIDVDACDAAARITRNLWVGRTLKLLLDLAGFKRIRVRLVGILRGKE
jgi:hypothetical protein